MSEQTEIFLRKSLLGVISDKEINEIIIKAKKIARRYGISLKELLLITYLINLVLLWVLKNGNY